MIISKWLLVFFYKIHIILCKDNVIVQLFEWRWIDIATECEQFLGPYGYTAVQTSPAAENLAIPLPDGSRSWPERYQVVSYAIQSRSGDIKDFRTMTSKCNAAGVKIYVEVVLNHMTNDSTSYLKGVGGSTVSFQESTYKAVPYSLSDFNYPRCRIKDDSNATQVRNCMVDNLKDLNQSNPHVRYVLTDYLNRLIDNGAAGFSVHAAKYMWPKDLEHIYKYVIDLNTEFGFQPDTGPFIYQELTPDASMSASEYGKIAHVADYVGSTFLSEAFTGAKPLCLLVEWGRSSLHKELKSDNVIVFVDNHITQRYSGLNYKDGPIYRAAIAFLLAHSYGHPRIMSSYYFTDVMDGPPSDEKKNLLSPLKGGKCVEGWICEHRWNITTSMLQFRDVVRGTKVTRWWDNGGNQIAFSRGNKGFIAFNMEVNQHMLVILSTGLPKGVYCDIRTGRPDFLKSTCLGKTVLVYNDGLAEIFISGKGDDIFLAIHVDYESRLS